MKPRQSCTRLCATDGPGSLLAYQQAGQLDRFAYTPFGHRSPAADLGFNGELADPFTGHYLLGNGYRAYNPVLMRFNSPDSLSPFGKGGVNAYAYCQGDPINRQDPTGHLSGPRSLFAVGKLRPTVPAPAFVLGDLDVFSGAPHVLENIVSRLPGDDLVSFSLTSRMASKVADSVVKPLPLINSAKDLNRDTILKLRDIALGRALNHTPSQVLQWQNLKEMAVQLPPTSIPQQEIFDLVIYGRERQGRRARYDRHRLRREH